MNNKKNYRLSELKEKSKTIIEEESKKQGIKININPITLVEYYKSDVFKQKTALQKIQTKFILTNAGGFYDSQTSEIVIFIDRMGYNEKINSINKLSAVVLATYHEYKHQLQHIGKYLTKGEKFIIEVERYLASIDIQDYKKHHNKYYMEIDADKYAVYQTYKYIKEKYPEKINETTIYLDKRLAINIHNKINYDSQKTFDKFYKICKQKNYQINSLNIPTISVFIDDNNEFYPLKRIIKAYKMKNIIDELTLLTVLGSKSYINHIRVKELTLEEKEFMLNIINKILEKEITRIDKNITYYQHRKIKIKEYVKIITKITDKIKFLDYESSRLRTYKLKTITDKIPNRYYKNLKEIKKQLKYDIIEEKKQTNKRI